MVFAVVFVVMSKDKHDFWSFLILLWSNLDCSRRWRWFWHSLLLRHSSWSKESLRHWGQQYRWALSGMSESESERERDRGRAGFHTCRRQCCRLRFYFFKWLNIGGAFLLCQTLVEHNNLKGRIQVIPGRVEEVHVPEQVDIIISEPMGYMLFNERMLETYIHARVSQCSWRN